MARTKPEDFKVEDFYFLKIKNMWRYFWSEHPAFWCICGYLFIEYFRPQSIYPAIDILPWAQLFLLGALGFSFLDKKSKIQWTQTHTWLVLFSLQIYISFIFAYNISISIEQHIQYTQWVIVFFLIVSIITSKERYYIFIVIFFMCSLKLSIGTAKIWAFRGFAFTDYGINGPQGYFQNSGELAIQMLILVSLSVYLARYMWVFSNRLEKLILSLAIITPILTIVGASSRGSQIALGLMIIVFFNKNIFKIKVLLIFVILMFSIFQFLPEEQIDRFKSMGGDGTSTQRILYWQNGIEMIKQHPFTGIGFFNFPAYFTDYYPQDINFINHKGERVAELPHNIFIQIGTDGGVLALIFYFLILKSVKIKIKKVDDNLCSQIYKGLLMGLFGFLVAGQFVSVAYYPFMWVSVTLLVALKLNFSKTESKTNISIQ
ncbi:O-antigen ligase family protein [Reinekea marina]|uniref:O-antigen ligase family protein n=1 Tax=Reinekea marina TaxID=1310421 RepID=A0ABV7WQN4_9GAMM